jgi:hypothetical protein
LLFLTPQVRNECSCYYGGRTQIGLTPAAVILLLALQVLFFVVSRTAARVVVIVESESARAPPHSL